MKVNALASLAVSGHRTDPEADHADVSTVRRSLEQRSERPTRIIVRKGLVPELSSECLGSVSGRPVDHSNHPIIRSDPRDPKKTAFLRKRSRKRDATRQQYGDRPDHHGEQAVPTGDDQAYHDGGSRRRDPKERRVGSEKAVLSGQDEGEHSGDLEQALGAVRP